MAVDENKLTENNQVKEKKKLRIAFGRFMHETNSFSSVDTTLDDFRRTHFIEGQDLLKAVEPKEWEVKGFLKNLELSGFQKAIKKHTDKDIETVPLFSGWSISGGPLARKDFDEIREKLKSQLEIAGDLDAVFFSIHGALGVRGEPDPESILLETIRSVVGNDIPVVVTMDLHANLDKRKVDLLTFICGYRSNPHWDMARTGYRAGDLLIKTVTGEIKPTVAWRSLPMLLGGGVTIDFLPPMLSIFQRMKEIEKDPRVLHCNVFMCHPFLEHQDLGWSVYVVTDNNPELAENIADELAERCWAVRKKLPPSFPEAGEAIQKARNAKLLRQAGCIAVCDASDVVGAGGTGENTALLKELLENAKDMISLVPIRDADVVHQLWDKNIGDDISVSVGGKLQPEINEPIEVKGKLMLKKVTDSFGKVIVLDLDHVKLVVTEGYALPMKPSFYEDLGLSTFKADIVVVKNFFHFRLYFLLKSRKNIYVKTKGITDLDRITQINTKYPCFPKDDVKDWRETDKKRRGIDTESPSLSLVTAESINNNKPVRKTDWKKEALFVGGIALLSFVLNRKKKV